jgi:hypothetical protein
MEPCVLKVTWARHPGSYWGLLSEIVGTVRDNLEQFPWVQTRDRVYARELSELQDQLGYLQLTEGSMELSGCDAEVLLRLQRASEANRNLVGQWRRTFAKLVGPDLNPGVSHIYIEVALLYGAELQTWFWAGADLPSDQISVRLKKGKA